MVNADVIDLYDRVAVGTKIIVLLQQDYLAATVKAHALRAIAANDASTA
jgi:hypothetical protein